MRRETTVRLASLLPVLLAAFGGRHVAVRGERQLWTGWRVRVRVHRQIKCVPILAGDVRQQDVLISFRYRLLPPHG